MLRARRFQKRERDQEGPKRKESLKHCTTLLYFRETALMFCFKTMDRLEKRLASSYMVSDLRMRKCRYREKWRWCCYREILARDGT